MDLKTKSWTSTFAVGNDDAIRTFAATHGDGNYLHHDAEKARATHWPRTKPLEGIVAPGMMILLHIAGTIGTKLQGCMVYDLAVRFTRPLYAEAVPTVVYTIINEGRLTAEVDMKIYNGSEQVGAGACKLLVPLKTEKGKEEWE